MGFYENELRASGVLEVELYEVIKSCTNEAGHSARPVLPYLYIKTVWTLDAKTHHAVYLGRGQVLLQAIRTIAAELFSAGSRCFGAPEAWQSVKVMACDKP